MTQTWRSPFGCQLEDSQTWKTAQNPPNPTFQVPRRVLAALARRPLKRRTVRRTTESLSKCLRTTSTISSFMQGMVKLQCKPFWFHSQHILHPVSYKDWTSKDELCLPLLDQSWALYDSLGVSAQLTGRKKPMKRRAKQDPNLSWLSRGFLLLWQQWQRECQDELQFGQHKQTQERDVIKKSEASGLAAHSLLNFCSPQQGLTSVLCYHFHLPVV